MFCYVIDYVFKQFEDILGHIRNELDQNEILSKHEVNDFPWLFYTVRVTSDSYSRPETRAGIHKACSRKKTDLKVDSFQTLFTDTFIGV